jgi:predicted XRE-type DNA-binding protein
MAEKEIDIFELYRRCKGFLQRRFLLIIVIGVIGLGMGFLMAVINAETYKTQFIVSSDFIKKEDIVVKIFPLLNQNNLSKSEIAVLFNSDVEIFSDLIEMSVDTFSLPKAVILELKLSDTLKMRDLKNEIVQFFTLQNDFQNLYKSVKETNKAYAKTLQAEIDKINAYQKSVLENEYDEHSFVMLGFTGSSGELLGIYEKKIATEQMINSNMPVKVSSLSLVTLESNNTAISMITWFVIFELLGLFVLLLLELDRMSKSKH